MVFCHGCYGRCIGHAAYEPGNLKVQLKKDEEIVRTLMASKGVGSSCTGADLVSQASPFTKRGRDWLARLDEGAGLRD